MAKKKKKTHLKKYTVVGYYGDNGQPWVEWIEAADPKQAVAAAVRQKSDRYAEERNDEPDEDLRELPADDLVVVEAFLGHVKGCLGNWNTAPVDQLDYG